MLGRIGLELQGAADVCRAEGRVEKCRQGWEGVDKRLFCRRALWMATFADLLQLF